VSFGKSKKKRKAQKKGILIENKKKRKKRNQQRGCFISLGFVWKVPDASDVLSKNGHNFSLGTPISVFFFFSESSRNFPYRAPGVVPVTVPKKSKKNC